MIDTAINASILAGKKILEIYNDLQSDHEIEKKADNSPLTRADKASNQIIEKILSSTGIPSLSEEGKEIKFSVRKKWKKFWLVDPLDGTKEFIKKNGEFTVNIALIENNKPVFGVIYIPVTRMLYVGEISLGAWKIEINDDEYSFDSIQKTGIKLPIKKENKKYTVAGSRSHMSKETEEYIDKIKKVHPHIDFISKGSSIKICLVAEGIADEYPRFGPTMEWDTAAGHAIANAAGKMLWLSNFSGELQYNKQDLLNPHFVVK